MFTVEMDFYIEEADCRPSAEPKGTGVSVQRPEAARRGGCQWPARQESSDSVNNSFAMFFVVRLLR
jgi:hypothetical protein